MVPLQALVVSPAATLAENMGCSASGLVPSPNEAPIEAYLSYMDERTGQLQRKSELAKLKIAPKFFAEGNFHTVHRAALTYKNQVVGADYVVKFGKEPYHKMKYCVEDLRVQSSAKRCAVNFNATARKKKLSTLVCREVKYHQLLLLTFKTAISGWPEHALAEPYVSSDGGMHKFNNNSGYINNCNCSICYTAQAYSHFSLESSNYEQLVCDVQGFPEEEGCCIFTDAAIHLMNSNNSGRPEDRQYGITNRGAQGIADFCSTHKCNKVCFALGLQKLKVKRTSG